MVRSRKQKRTLIDMGDKNYDFILKRERIIYSYLCCKYINKKEMKKIEENLKFQSYKEWKEYITKKYNKCDVDSLVEFRRLLNQLKRNIAPSSTYLGFCFPAVLALILSKSADMLWSLNINEVELTDWRVFAIYAIVYIFAIGLVMIPVMGILLAIIFPIMNNDLEENLYNDYIEVIDELIKDKK